LLETQGLHIKRFILGVGLKKSVLTDWIKTLTNSGFKSGAHSSKMFNTPSAHWSMINPVGGFFSTLNFSPFKVYPRIKLSPNRISFLEELYLRSKFKSFFAV
jgi:hypothetical protein